METRGLKKHFPVSKGLLFAKPVNWIRAVDGVDLCIRKGETFGLVGESGCGKTTTAKLILRLEKATDGSILFHGDEVVSSWRGELKYLRSIQAVFQDPYSSLNPRMRVRDIISEPLLVIEGMPKKRAGERVVECLEQVGMRRADVGLYPHEFSGGQRQRIAIARALAPNPECIVLDEPVSALDVSIRAQIVNLLKDLQQQLGVTYLMIAHDLATVRYMSSTIGIMYLGKLVEIGASEDVFSNPLHPYTRALLSAALPSHPDIPRKAIALSGEVPSPLDPPAGCRFHPRCFEKQTRSACSEVMPDLKDVGGLHQVACHLC